MNLVKLVVGDTLAIVLGGNVTTGYSWELSDMPPCITSLGQTSESASTTRAALMGAPTPSKWSFRADSVCRCGLIRMRYGRSWDATTFQYYDLLVNVVAPGATKAAQTITVAGPSNSTLAANAAPPSIAN